MLIAIAIMFSVAMVVIALRSLFRDRQRRTIAEQRIENLRLRREMEKHNDKSE